MAPDKGDYNRASALHAFDASCHHEGGVRNRSRHSTGGRCSAYGDTGPPKDPPRLHDPQLSAFAMAHLPLTRVRINSTVGGWDIANDETKNRFGFWHHLGHLSQQRNRNETVRYRLLSAFWMARLTVPPRRAAFCRPG